jgi:hypothetical protein
MMTNEGILQALQRAVAALEQLDKATVNDNRLVWIADQLHAYANRIAPWRQIYPIISLSVGGLTEEVLKRWQWPDTLTRSTSSPNVMEIVQRACSVVSNRDPLALTYDPLVERVCDFVEAYAMGADIALTRKEPREEL